MYFPSAKEKKIRIIFCFHFCAIEIAIFSPGVNTNSDVEMLYFNLIHSEMKWFLLSSNILQLQNILKGLNAPVIVYIDTKH